MKRKIEALQPAISVEDCPLENPYCVRCGEGTCEHFRGVMVLRSGYIGIVCTAALEEDDGSPGVGVEALQSSLCDGQCGKLPTRD